MKPKIVIVGAGASGLVSAIAAAKNSKNSEVIILERKDRAGKKILATGNGRCNITNLNIDKNNYYSQDLSLVENIIKEYTPETIISFFESIGVMCRVEKNRVYPYSNNASSVLTCLRNKLMSLNVKEVVDFDVNSIKSEKGSYKIISTDKRSIVADKVIIATGGCASENLGSNGSGFKIMQDLGHSCTKLHPALVQLKIEEDLRSLKGVKFEGTARIKHKSNILGEEQGEILFTDYGLSGIAIMELSKFTRYQKNLSIELDFFPKHTKDEVKILLQARKENLKQLDLASFFIGLLNKNLGQVLLKKSGIDKLSLQVLTLTDKQINTLSANLKNFSLKITGTNGFKNAQVTAGGILTDEFNIHTLESKINKNLYAVGEVLDVFGDCGGYNLHFAWATGLRAGYSASTKES